MNLIMTFNTAKCQEIFRNRFTGASGIPFHDFNSGKTINKTTVDPSDISLYCNARKDDILSFYYKSLLSFSEGLDAFSRKNYTWATIKLYYSVYFGLRSSLLCRNIVLVRANKHLYKFKIALGEQYDKPKEMTDHGGTIHTYVDLFQRTDFFCSNTLENMNAYFWLKNCREIVNYKDGVFHDPETIDIWDDIIEDITKFGIKKTLTYLVDEKDKYCFLPEYAVLAIPLNRILIVAQEVKNELSEQLQDSQKDWIKSILKDNLDSEYINKLLLSSN